MDPQELQSMFAVTLDDRLLSRCFMKAVVW